MEKGFYDDHNWITFELGNYDITLFSSPNEEDSWSLRYYRWNSGHSRAISLCLFNREYGVSWVKRTS